jgi:methyl-accepting chemotaxis protein
MRLADIGIAKKLAAGYLIILVVIAVVSAVSLVNLRRMDQAAELNTRSYEAISNSKDILYGLINMETGIRGFIITGRDDFLTPL